MEKCSVMFAITGFRKIFRDGFPIDERVHFRKNHDRLGGGTRAVGYRYWAPFFVREYRRTVPDVGEGACQLLQSLSNVLFHITLPPAGGLLVTGRKHRHGLCFYDADEILTEAKDVRELSRVLAVLHLWGNVSISWIDGIDDQVSLPFELRSFV